MLINEIKNEIIKNAISFMFQKWNCGQQYFNTYKIPSFFEGEEIPENIPDYNIIRDIGKWKFIISFFRFWKPSKKKPKEVDFFKEYYIIIKDWKFSDVLRKDEFRKVDKIGLEVFKDF